MQLINVSLAKVVVGAVTLLVLSSVYTKPASAGRYAVAFMNTVESCGGIPGPNCPHA